MNQFLSPMLRLRVVKGGKGERSAAEARPLELKLRALVIVPTVQHALLPLTRCGGFSGFAHAADPFSG